MSLSIAWIAIVVGLRRWDDDRFYTLAEVADIERKGGELVHCETIPEGGEMWDHHPNDPNR